MYPTPKDTFVVTVVSPGHMCLIIP